MKFILTKKENIILEPNKNIIIETEKLYNKYTIYKLNHNYQVTDFKESIKAANVFDITVIYLQKYYIFDINNGRWYEKYNKNNEK